MSAESRHPIVDLSVLRRAVREVDAGSGEGAATCDSGNERSAGPEWATSSPGSVQLAASRTKAVSTNCSNLTMSPPRTTKWWATRTASGLPVAAVPGGVARQDDDVLTVDDVGVVVGDPAVPFRAELLHHVRGHAVGGAVGAREREAGHLGPLHIGGERRAQGLEVAGRGGEVLAAYDLGRATAPGSAPCHLALGDLGAEVGGDHEPGVRVGGRAARPRPRQRRRRRRWSARTARGSRGCG